MILKGAQRGGARQLAVHLLNDIENDHVTVHELRGFISDDLAGALAEAHAISKGTKCRQFMFSLSLNPPKDAGCTIEDMVAAADRAEKALGLSAQPRAIVIHEKEGRRHIHTVWSRIDVNTMKAVELPFFKNRMAALSKELYLERGWNLPDGHRENGWKNPLNFTLAEWQQAKRLGLDPREIKQLFADAWSHSGSITSFRAALEERGFFLAQGDRRGFVAVDIHGEVFSVSRMIGVKSRQLEGRLGLPLALPPVDEIKSSIVDRMVGTLKRHLRDVREQHRKERRPLDEQRREVIAAQRAERANLAAMQRERQRRETNERQARFRRGVKGLWDVLTGRAAAMRRENERLTHEARLRDAAQREAMVISQARERAALQERMKALRRAQRQSIIRIGRYVVGLIADRDPPQHLRDRGLELRL